MSQTVYKTNPIVSLDDTQFVSQLYGSGIGLPGTANTNTLTQNEQRIRGMVSTGNLDYISKQGFLKYEAIKATGDVLLNGKFNTLYTVENSNSVAGIDIQVQLQGFTESLFTVPAGEIRQIVIDGVGTLNASSPIGISSPLGVIAVSGLLN
jgi:hypothetical protein